MRVRVKASWHRGAPLSEKDLERTQILYGNLRVSWWSAAPSQPRLTAQLIDAAPGGCDPLLPPLLDVVLASVTSRHLVLRGVETLKTARGKVEVVQEWIVGARLD